MSELSGTVDLPDEVSGDEWAELVELGKELRRQGLPTKSLTHAMRAAARCNVLADKLKERNGRALRAEAELVSVRAERDELEAALRGVLDSIQTKGAWTKCRIIAARALFTRFQFGDTTQPGGAA